MSSEPVGVETPIDHNFHPQPSAKQERWESTLPPEYWEYRERWNINPTNRVVEGFPIHLDIEATSACNLRCTMCPRTEMLADGTFWKVEMFDYDLYTRLIDEGVKHGLASVKFQYLGEPTMNARLVDMIKYAKDKGVVDVMFNTNATKLTDKLCREIIASGVDKVFFSFDSPDPEQFNKIRIKGDFHQVLGRIKRFHEIREEMGSVSPFTRVSMVLMKENEDQWIRFKELMEPIVDVVAWVDYVDHSSQEKSGKELIPQEQSKKKFCCPQLWQRMFIHPDGVVTVCCLDSARELQMGNVKEQSAHEIWTGPEYQRLRDLHAAGRSQEIPTCKGCALTRY